MSRGPDGRVGRPSSCPCLVTRARLPRLLCCIRFGQGHGDGTQADSETETSSCTRIRERNTATHGQRTRTSRRRHHAQSTQHLSKATADTKQPTPKERNGGHHEHSQPEHHRAFEPQFERGVVRSCNLLPCPHGRSVGRVRQQVGWWGSGWRWGVGQAVWSCRDCTVPLEVCTVYVREHVTLV